MGRSICTTAFLVFGAAAWGGGPLPPSPPAATPAAASAQGLSRRGASARSRAGVAGPFSALPDAAARHPAAADPVALSLSKTWNAGTGAWDLTLDWSGGTAPFTVSRCGEPSFQASPATLAQGLDGAPFEAGEDPSAPLECFAVTDGEGVSPAVEAIGYDPAPRPEPPVLSANGLWWGDTVTLQSRYLDALPEGNLLFLSVREARAASVVDGGGGFAVEAAFEIPDDARGAQAFVSSRGLVPTQAPFLELHPRGLPHYAGLRAVVYAPQTGHIWVAADGRVDEVDLFQRDPVVLRSLTGYARPCLSRVTTAGTLLVVDGVAGVSQVDEIDVQTGAVTKYADTHAGAFTRDVLPVGLAADPDGSACMIADALYGAGAGRLVKVPRANATAIRDAYGNWTAWAFPDPCGLEVGLGHVVRAGSADGWIGYCPDATHTYLDTYTDGAPRSLEVDRDVSLLTYDRYYYYGDPGACMAFNGNDLASAPTSAPPSHLGAVVYAEEGHLCVQPLWAYRVEGEAPLRVILNNGGQEAPYPAAEQVADGLLQLRVRGWNGVPLTLRLEDPPDTSPYVPWGSWTAKPGKTAALPYVANDNEVWTENPLPAFGLSAYSSGPFAQEITVTPSNDHTAVFYLKLPPRYSGDNGRVAVYKIDPKTGQEVPDKVPSRSPVYTGWKRVYVERDKMFRRGGLLYADFDPSSCGASCDQIVVYDWTNASIGDTVVVFDESITYEHGGEKRTITDISGSNGGVRTITLDSPLTKRYYATGHDTSSPPLPTFANGHSGGAGVVYSTVSINGQTITDADPNQLNGPGSAFYDADMRDIEQPFDDAYVEFFGQRSGMGAVPYVHWATDATADQLISFSNLWWSTANRGAPNYLHLLGIEGATPSNPNQVGGSPYRTAGGPQSGASYIYVGQIEQNHPGDPATQHAVNQYCTVHELTHNFSVNGYTVQTYHCSEAASSPPEDSHGCIMHAAFVTYLGSNPRFCVPHVLTGGGALTDVHVSVRMQQDPLPY